MSTVSHFTSSTGLLAQEAGNQEFVDVRRRGNNRRKRDRRIGADRNRYRHTPRHLLAFGDARAAAGARHHVERGGDRLSLAMGRGATHALAIVLGALLLALPVHAGAALVVDMQAIHADVALALRRVFGHDRRQRDEAAAVLRPALQDREVEQREVVVLDDFLARPALHFFGEELAQVGQHGQHLDFVEQALGRLHVHEVLDAVGDFVQRVDVERHLHAALGAKLVDEHPRAGIALDVLEQQGRTARPVRAARVPTWRRGR